MIRNLTPHPVTIYGENGEVLAAFESEGKDAIPRVREEHIFDGTITVDGVPVPVYRVQYTKVGNLPPKRPGVNLIVSMLTAQAAEPDRDDLLVPIGQVRDEQGRIIGCRGLGRLSSAPQAPRYFLDSVHINNDPATLDNGIFLRGTDGTERHLSPDPGRLSDREINSYGFRRVGEWQSEPPFSEWVEVVPL